MSTRTYDPKKVYVHITNATVNHLVTGFASGTFVTCARNNDMVDMVTGGKGESTQVIHGLEDGTITMTLKNTSPSLPVLRALASSRELFSCFVVDNNPDSYMKAGGTDCRFVRPPDESRGQSVENITATVLVGKYTIKTS